MTSDFSTRVSEAWSRYWKLPESERQTFLARLGQDDVEVAHELTKRLTDGENSLPATIEFDDSSNSLPPPTIELGPIREHSPPSGEETLGDRRTPSLADDLPRTAGRYQIESEIARGGMGVVLRALDPTVGRLLAVKVILPNAMKSPEGLQRFLAEAQITGQLQHPGIPPVHEIGTLEQDGRPFFALKLIEGETLSKILRQRTSPADNLSRFLGIFEQICQTLAYAHSCGILHRDLKPANIMVGAFGEVQVMDWGIAKRIGNLETVRPELATTFRLPLDAPPSTQDGAAMGTIPFMAPEQARGEIDQLDERADVFGLGAMLSVILTGKPPFASSDPSAVFALARRGDLQDAFARLRQSGADIELLELCKACLAPSKEDRPRDAGEVADGVAHYLQGVQEKLKQAELDREKAQVQAEEERKRRHVEGARANEERKRREAEQAQAESERRRRRATLALAAVVLLFVVGVGAAAFWYQQDRARRRIDKARRSAQRQARKSHLYGEVKTALDEADQHLTQLHRDLRDPTEVRQLMSNLRRWKQFLEAARSALGRVESVPPADRKLIDATYQERFQSLKDRLQSAQRDWELADKLDRIRLRTATLTDDESHLVVSPEIASAYANVLKEYQWDVLSVAPKKTGDRLRTSPFRFVLAATLDHWASIMPKANDKKRLLEIARQGDPSEWRDRFRRLGPLRDTADVDRWLQQIDPSKESPQFLISVAQKLDREGVNATTFLRSARVYHTQDFWLLFALGAAVKDPQEQIGFYQAALAVRPDSAVAYNNLGVALTRLDEFDGAMGAFTKAKKLNPKYALVWVNLGWLHKTKGDAEAALRHYRHALALAPNEPVTHFNVGNTLLTKNELEAANTHLLRAVELRPDMPKAWYALGMLRKARKNWKGAAEAFRKATKIKVDYSEAWNNLGAVRTELGDFSGALVAYQKGLGVSPKSAKTWFNLAKFLNDRRQYAEAEPAVRQAIEANPSDGDSHALLGWVLSRQGKLQEAAKACREAQKLLPQDSPVRQTVRSVLAFCVPRIKLQKQEQVKKIDLKSAHRGFSCRLSKDDPLDVLPNTNASHRKAFVVWLRGGSTWLLHVTGDFDTFFRVENSAYRILAFNDDISRDDRSSRLVFTTPRDGKYYFVVTSFLPRATGPFTLTMNELIQSGKPQPDTHALTKADPTTFGSHYRQYAINFVANRVYSIRLESRQFPPFLSVRDARKNVRVAKTNVFVPHEKHSARIDFVPKSTGKYQIRVTTQGAGQVGEYTFQVLRFVRKRRN